ncbi:MAG: bifunctional folylpolyglutamate synthase/dihydrofolate synthase [Acetatifactor sp.]|nr:bifunctional folylpolyglutamate synthase/dihydrofolate synthase [Acetatifactor sp.]
MTTPKNYEEAVNYIMDIPKFAGKNTMEDTVRFLKLLGDPDKNMKIIHVAGTNGKGSVCSFIKCMLKESGYTTAVFTSPHLVDIRERIEINGEMISKETFFEAFLKIYEKLEKAGYHPSFFEYLFLMAMVIFDENPTDFVILETGLGGRLDATNAIRNKEVSVITRLSLDHCEYLGDTVEEIAAEKAGIIADHTPCVFLTENESVNSVIEKRAKAVGAPLIEVGKNDYSLIEIKNKTIDFSLCSRYYGNVRCSLHTNASYQPENASLALRACEIVDRLGRMTIETIREGIDEFFWAGRMQEVLPEIYVDGAHNEDGIRAFLESVGNDTFSGERILVLGTMADKDYPSMLKEITQAGLFGEIVFTKAKNTRAADSSKLLKNLHGFRGKTRVTDTVAQALSYVYKNRNGRRVYIAGSLYLVGEVLTEAEKFQGEEHD